MSKDTIGHDLAGVKTNAHLNEVPDRCPRCHRNVQPKFQHMANVPDRSIGQAIFQCANLKCQELFIATYGGISNRAQGRFDYHLLGVSPERASEAEFPESVAKTSPAFVQIFNQALAAEAAKLDQLVGIGLRKALEFLVKDYAVSEFPDKADEVRKSLLAACINQYVSDQNVKECAKRAAWLGNDETHYVKKWEQKDINDLKLLVRLTVNWMDNAILTKKYIQEMSGGKA